MRDLWLSIHPRWINKILDGTKTIELRRHAPSVGIGATAILYATSPAMSIVATAKIAGIHEMSCDELWLEHGDAAGTNQAEFDGYFDGVTKGTAIALTAVHKFARPLPLQEIRELGHQPAQGWRYVDAGVTNQLVALAASQGDL